MLPTREEYKEIINEKMVEKWDKNKKKQYTKLPTTDDYKKLIDSALESEGIIVKNHDYFSRIRGQIRAMTDSKEEYKALRDDILGAYENHRGSDKIYTVRLSTDFKRFPQEPTDEVVNFKGSDPINPNHDLSKAKGNGNIFSAGFNQDFSKNESCFNVNHIREMDNYSAKYFWTLGKNGVMITKMTGTSYDDLPRNEKGQIDTNPRISRAMDEQNSVYLDSFFKSEYGAEYHENVGRAGRGEITYEEARELDKQSFNKFETNYCKECIDDLDSCLRNEGLFNVNTGDRLFQFSYIRTGNNKEITTWK